MLRLMAYRGLEAAVSLQSDRPTHSESVLFFSEHFFHLFGPSSLTLNYKTYTLIFKYLSKSHNCSFTMTL